MIHQTLQKLGFNDKEIEIYLVILEHAKIAPADVSKITGINRTTVYSTGKELVKKGLIVEDLGGSVMYYVANPPKSLGLLAEMEQRELAQKKKLIDSAIEELEVLPKAKQYAIPKIRFVDEDDLENHLYTQVSKWNENMMKVDTTWWGFQDHSFAENFEKWIEWYWSNAPKTIDLKLLSNESDIEQQMKRKKITERVIRFWKKDIDFTATTWVIGDYTIVINTQKRPYYMIELYDKLVAHNMREVFKNLWEEIDVSG